MPEPIDITSNNNQTKTLVCIQKNFKPNLTVGEKYKASIFDQHFGPRLKGKTPDHRLARWRQAHNQASRKYATQAVINEKDNLKPVANKNFYAFKNFAPGSTLSISPEIARNTWPQKKLDTHTVNKESDNISHEKEKINREEQSAGAGTPRSSTQQFDRKRIRKINPRGIRTKFFCRRDRLAGQPVSISGVFNSIDDSSFN